MRARSRLVPRPVAALLAATVVAAVAAVAGLAGCGASAGGAAATPAATVAEESSRPAPTPEPSGEAIGDAGEPADVLHAGLDETRVTLTRLADGVWLHMTLGEFGSDRVPANGLVVVGPEGALLVDTPWTPEQTAVLDELVRTELGVDIVAAVATHAHDDRLGGAPYLVEKGVPITSLRVVADQAEGSPYVVPDDVHDGEWAGLTLAGVDVELFYPGPSHTVDSTVVWLPGSEVLFGGCMVKDLESTAVPDGADERAAWVAALDQVTARYGHAALLVPGHGAPGEPAALLRHTRELLAD